MPGKFEERIDPIVTESGKSIGRLSWEFIGSYLDNQSVARLARGHQFFTFIFKENLLQRKRMALMSLMALIEQPALFDPQEILDIIVKAPSLLFEKIEYMDRYGVTRNISPYQLMIHSCHFILAPYALKTAQRYL